MLITQLAQIFLSAASAVEPDAGALSRPMVSQDRVRYRLAMDAVAGLKISAVSVRPVPPANRMRLSAKRVAE